MSLAPAWGAPHGLQRLQNLPEVPEEVPGGGPPGSIPNIADDPRTYLRMFREEAGLHLPEKALKDREQLWAGEWNWSTSGVRPSSWPPWLILRPDRSLVEWGQVLEGMGMDNRSLCTFVSLTNHTPGNNGGFMEATRLIAHALKDTRDRKHPNPSQWMQRGATEAMNALDDPGLWERGPTAWGPVEERGRGRSQSRRFQ